MWMQELLRRNFHKKILSQDLIVSQRSILKTALFSDFKHQDVLCFFWFQLCFIVVAFQNHFIINPCRFPRHDSEIPIFHFPPVVLPTDFRRISQSSPKLPPSWDPLKRLPFARCLAFDSIQTTGFLGNLKGEEGWWRGDRLGWGGEGHIQRISFGVGDFLVAKQQIVVRLWWFMFFLEEVGYVFFATPTSLEGGKNDYFEWVYSSNKLYLKK